MSPPTPGRFICTTWRFSCVSRGAESGQRWSALAWAERLEHSSLVSIQVAREFWQKHGYAAVDDLDLVQLANLQT